MLGDLLSKYGLTNILGTVTAALGMALGVFKYLGCEPGALDFAATCTLPTWIPVTWTPIAIAVTGGLAFLSKLLRPGTVLRNLFGGTAVIVPKEVAATLKTAENVVTPEQVATKTIAAK